MKDACKQCAWYWKDFDTGEYCCHNRCEDTRDDCLLVEKECEQDG